MPIVAQRNGDFSALAAGIHHPDTLADDVRQPLPGFRIPEAKLNPLTRAAQAAMPLPTIGVNQYVNASGVLRQDADNCSLRADWVEKDKIMTFGRYSIWDDARQQYLSLDVQDAFRISPTFTLNLGLRYELAPPMDDHRQQMGGIDDRNVPSPWDVFGEGRLAFYEPLFFICGQNGYPKGCAYTGKNNWAPRLGLAWNVTSQTVIRVGASIFYAATDANPLFRLAAVLPGNIAQTLSANAFIPQFRNFDIFGPAEVGPRQIQFALRLIW